MSLDIIEKAQELFKEEKEIEAISLLRPLSESGDVLAQANLGFFLAYAIKENNIKEAESLLNQACNKGDSSACHNLGSLWLGTSPSIGKDLKKAAKFYLKARDLGGPVADESFYERWEEELNC